MKRILSSLVLLQVAFVATANLNAPCSTAAECGQNTHMICNNGFCQCDYYSQIYDQDRNQCFLLVGSECGTSPEASELSPSTPATCVVHAHCKDSSCRCQPGYRMTADFLCKPDHGSPCHAKDDCDETQGLKCFQATCHCLNSTWAYQGHFGCIDPDNRQFNEMMSLLNQTQTLLRENNLEIRDMFNDLGLQNDPNTEQIFGNMLAEARQFQDTYNTHDLQFAAQNQNAQSGGGGGAGGTGLNIGQLFQLFQSFQSLLGTRNQNSGGGASASSGSGSGSGNNNGLFGGFFRNLFGGGDSSSQAGYPESQTSGYQGSGQPEQMQGQRFNLINNFLNLFNQLIPIVRQLRMRFSPVRFFQNLFNRFSPSTTTAAPPPPPPPPAQAAHNQAPTLIQHNGNFGTNPIFDGNNPSNDQANTQGAGTLAFIQRTRERFRQALRGGRPAAGGYGPPPKPTNTYGPPPSGTYGPPAPAAETPAATQAEQAGASQQFFNTNPVRGQNPTFTIQASSNQLGANNYNNNNNLANSAATQHLRQAPAPAQRQQNFGASLPSPSTFNSGSHPNPQSFFSQSSQQQQQHPNNQQQFHNNFQNQNNQQTFNGQATSQHQNYNGQQNSHSHQQSYNAQQNFHNQQSAPQSGNHHNQQQQHSFQQTSNQNGFSYNSNNNRPPSYSGESNNNRLPSTTPIPSVPQFKLHVGSQHNVIPQNQKQEHEALSQNYILSEADDPHPGFTPISSSTTSESTNHHQSFRTAARFERVGHDDPNRSNDEEPEDNWRDSF